MIEINKEYERVFELLNKKVNMFITGEAGTGKSTLLQYLVNNKLKRTETVILAPTGRAAINVNGQTIHSFFQFVLGMLDNDYCPLSFNKDKIDTIKAIKTIIIDEVSMVRADLMAAIDRTLRFYRRSTRPFGGIQMLFFGDMYQLPPVLTKSEFDVYAMLGYNSPYFFDAGVFKTSKIAYINLTTIYRQKDENFKKLLNRIRHNDVDSEVMKEINSRMEVKVGRAPENLLILTVTNNVADKINSERLNKLKGPIVQLNGTFTGDFKRNSSLPVPDMIFLKPGAPVMMARNDPMGRWVNGSIGIFKGKRVNLNDDMYSDDSDIQVEINGVNYFVSKATWENTKYGLSSEGNIESSVSGTYSQYPVKLAWAVTIHKSQGQTFETVVIDKEGGAFAHGQMYVALSRCTSLEGIYLRNPIQKSDIILDKAVVNLEDYFITA